MFYKNWKNAFWVFFFTNVVVCSCVSGMEMKKTQEVGGIESVLKRLYKVSSGEVLPVYKGAAGEFIWPIRVESVPRKNKRMLRVSHLNDEYREQRFQIFLNEAHSCELCSIES